MSGEIYDAAVVTAPTVGQIQVIPLSTVVATGDLTALGAGWYTFDSEGCTSYITFSATSPTTPDPNATSGDARCARLPQDQTKDWWVDANRLYFAVITATGTGNLRISKSSRP